MNKIILVAETGADIPDEFVKKYQLNILPMSVSFENETLMDGDFPVNKIYQYYQTMKKLPQTSGVNPEHYRSLFKKLHYECPKAEILHLCYSAATTCTYQNALMGSNGMSFVTHVDTKAVSGGQAAIVIRTAEYLVNNPNISMEKLLQEISNWKKQMRMCFLPGNLNYLRTGGRVSNGEYLGATVLSIKPLIEMDDGRLVSTKRYRGSMKKISSKLIEDYFEKENPDLERVYFLYSEGLEDGLRKTLEKEASQHGANHVIWIKTGGVVSTHSGPGAFGIAGFNIEKG